MDLLINNVLVALSSIKSNLLRAILTMLIISFGMMALIGILTASDALVYSLNKNYGTLGVNSFSVHPKSSQITSSESSTNDLYQIFTFRQAYEFKQKFADQGDVTIFISGSRNAEIRTGKQKTSPNVTIQCIDEKYFSVTGKEIQYGRNFTELEVLNANQIAIVGPEIVEILFEGKPEKALESYINIGNRVLQIKGISKSQGSNFDNNSDLVVMIPLQLGMQLYAHNKTNYNIEVKIKDATKYNETIEASIPILRNVRKLRTKQGNNFEFEKSDELLKEIQEDTKAVRIIVLIIAIITLIGSAVGLLNIMLVSVAERTKEIGVRKALGANNNMILMQFLIEAIVICLLGGGIGIVLGIGIGNIVSILMKSNFILPLVWIVTGVIISILVGVIAGIYPARKAAVLDPIESLRYDG